MMSIDQLVALIRAASAENRARDRAAQRAWMDEQGLRGPLAPEWEVTPGALATLPIERHHGPGAAPGRTILYLHGGGYVAGSPRSHRGMISHLAAAAGAETIALDYRLAPEHPFPAALDDAVAAIAALAEAGQDLSRLAVVGDSAGGGLALAAALRRRDENLPVPGALGLISPWTDLMLEGASIDARAALDPIVSREGLEACAAAYLAGGDGFDPWASPLRADLRGLPEIMIQVGEAEILLDDSTALARRLEQSGARVALEQSPAMIHVWHMFYWALPEAREAICRLGAWLATRLG